PDPEFGFWGGGSPGARVAPAEALRSCSRHWSRSVPESSLQRSAPRGEGAGVARPSGVPDLSPGCTEPPLIAPSLGFAPSFASCANARAEKRSSAHAMDFMPVQLQ